MDREQGHDEGVVMFECDNCGDRVVKEKAKGIGFLCGPCMREYVEDQG